MPSACGRATGRSAKPLRPCRSRSPRPHSGSPAGAAQRALAPRVPAGAGRSPASRPGPVVELSSPATRSTRRSPEALAALARRRSAHGEARWHATRELSHDEPATIHLGLDVFAPRGQEVRAPLAGRVERGRRARARARRRAARRAPGRRSRRRWRPARRSRRARSSGTCARTARCPRICTCRPPRRASRCPASPPRARGRLAGALPASRRRCSGSAPRRTRRRRRAGARAGARRSRRPSRSTTPIRPRWCAAFASTSTTRRPAPTSTASTTWRSPVTATRASQPRPRGSCGCSTRTRASSTRA